ncbi:MAG TPA: shikimate dehydrogenase, partial [Burkholderiaceae bacterium]
MTRSDDTRAPARLAVIGHPVAHSRSPQIHARFGADGGVAVDYVRIEAPLDGFAATVAAFAA